MRESKFTTRIMIAVLCIGVAVYIAVSFFRNWKEPVVTAYAYVHTQNVGAEATGLFVRRETVLPDSGGSYVDQILSEGEKASAGQAVALLYSDSSALTTRQSIRALSAEIEQLEYALTTGTQATDVSRLDAQVISAITALRGLTARGDLTLLEEYTLNLRTLVFKRDYAYGDTAAAGQMKLLIEDKREQLRLLDSSLNQVSRTVYAPTAGVFSSSVDGWEGELSPDMLDELTPEGLSGLLSRKPAARENTVGKLITDSTWYFAALLPGSDAGLQAGNTYQLTFSGDYYGQIPMLLERVALDGERTLAIFSCRSHLADTTLLRVQTVDVVIRRLEGIRIPRKALRIETETVTDDDGVQREVNHYRVYTVIRSQAREQEVEVLYTDDDFYLVRPVDDAASDRLRAGDEVILSSSGIYDGKVVR